MIIVFLITFYHTLWTLLVQDKHQDFTELSAAHERLDICHYHVDDRKGNEMFYVCHDVTVGEVVFYGCKEASRPELAAWGQSIYNHQVVCVWDLLWKKHASDRSKNALFTAVFVFLQLFSSSASRQHKKSRSFTTWLMKTHHQVLKCKSVIQRGLPLFISMWYLLH